MFKLAGSWTLVIVAVAALGSFGCAATESATTPRHASAQHGDTVEVLLDSQPERPFVVKGELSSKTANNPASIDEMRHLAAEAGYDGIYWIDCTSPCSGMCTAKGFVYTDRTNIASR